MATEIVHHKAHKWLDANMPGWTNTHLRSLVILLKEQHRDTRHACAENCATWLSTDGDQAHDLCINTRLE